MNQLSVSDVEKQPAHTAIWAINTAPDSILEQTGEILLTIQKLNGSGNDPLRIPQTWLPQELTAQVPRKQLLASAQFRQAIQGQLIGLITEADAKRLLSQDGASEEQAKLLARKRIIKESSAARAITGEVKLISGGDQGDDDLERHSLADDVIIAGDEKDEVEPGVSSNFAMWTDRLLLTTDIEAKNSLRSRKKFTTLELAFLARKLKVTSLVNTFAMVNKSLNKANTK